MSRALQFTIVVSALVAIVSQSADGWWHSVHYIAKPLTTFAVLLLAATTRNPHSARYRTLIVGGLAFSLVGDVLLMLPRDLFVAGLAVFLLGHVCFIAAFLTQSAFAARKTAFVGYALVAAALVSALLPVIPPALRIPVLVYVVVIVTMASQGASWMLLDSGAPSARLAAMGGAWFVVSDATLAIDRFRMDVPFRDVVVLGTYWVAVWLLARSVARE